MNGFPKEPKLRTKGLNVLNKISLYENDIEVFNLENNVMNEIKEFSDIYMWHLHSR